MPKLRTLKTGIASIGSPLAPTFDNRDQQRSVIEPWRAWYSTARWRKLRDLVLLRDSYTCRYPGCGLITGNTSDLVAHHKIRHRGNDVLFWDPNNIECVCRWCHDGPIKAAERAEQWGAGA